LHRRFWVCRLNNSGQSLGSSNSWGVALGDVDGDNDLDAFVANCVYQPNKVYLYVAPEPIPTLTEWGVIIFLTLMMGIGVVMIVRKRRIA